MAQHVENPQDVRKGPAWLALSLVELRQRGYEQHRDAAIACRRWSHASGMDAMATGLMVAANILREELRNTVGPVQAEALDEPKQLKVLRLCLALVELRKRGYDEQRDAAIASHQWGQAGGMEAISTGLMCALNIMREELGMEFIEDEDRDDNDYTGPW